MKPKLPRVLLIVWIVFAVAPTRAASNVAGSLAPAPAQGAAKEEPVVLSIFQVTGDKDEGYRSTQTVSGSRTLADLRDTPNSISVLNRELLDDLIATKISDAMFFAVTGEIDTNGESANEGFVFRGILANLRLRNGVTWYGGTSDSYAIERVELLRGPQAFLYGEGTAGGLINQLTKQASYRNFEKANLMFGYRTKIWKRSVDFNLNINNVMDRDYFRSYALSTGAWGDGRTFRCSARIAF